VDVTARAGPPASFSAVSLRMIALPGVQVRCIGILGDSIARIHMETKRRPRFIIEKTI
jgi:hypothetical protein